MAENALIRSTGLFFFYALLDEALARKAAAHVLSDIFRQKQMKKIDEQSWPSLIVLHTQKYWSKLQKKRKKGAQGVLTFESGFYLPEKVDLGFWQQFHREAPSDEMLSVIWSKVLGLNDEDIAKGLGVTTGTVRHRVGRGLRQFGSIISARTEPRKS